MFILFKQSPLSVLSKFVVTGILCLSLGFSSRSFAQETKTDTVDHVLKHSPKKATIMSAVLPGLGQVYNKKYWKVPIIYGGFAGLGYVIKVNNDGYSTYRNAYIKKLDTDPTNDVFDEMRYTKDDLKLLKDAYRRDRDLAMIATFIVYVLNILDANVDAHLFYFNVSNDLSLRVQPSPLYLPYSNTSYVGLNLTLNFK